MLDYHLQRPSHSPWSQLGMLLGLCFGGLLVGYLIAVPIALSSLHISAPGLQDALLSPENAEVTNLFQIIVTFFFMALPPLVLAAIMHKPVFRYVGFNEAVSWKQIFMVAGIVVISLLLSGVLARITTMIPLSKEVADYFRAKEEQYDKAVIAMAQMKTLGQYLLSLLIIGLMPAMFEEMMFRGALQPTLISITKNSFAGILITSILFSALHASFYGFLSRLALGIVIGYIFFYSKNLWLSVAAHFLNNAVGLTQMYYLSKAGRLNSEAMNDTFPLYYGVIAVATLFALFFIFKRESEVVISMYNHPQVSEVTGEETRKFE